MRWYDLRPRGKIEFLLFVTGINLTLLNFIMVQHATVAFRQMEIAVIVFSLAYFSGISLGYFFSDRLPRAIIRRLLPAFLIIQMTMIVLLQALFYVVSSDVGKWMDFRDMPIEFFEILPNGERDVHPSPAGHQWIAEHVAEVVRVKSLLH